MDTDKTPVAPAAARRGWRENISVNQSSSVVKNCGGKASALSEKSAVKTGAVARLFRWTILQEAAEEAEAFQPAFQRYFKPQRAQRPSNRA